MDSLTNSRPLLEPTHPSDSEDFVEEDSIQKDEYTPDDFNDEDDDQEQLFKTPLIAPHDKFSFTYIVFYLLGTTTMLPWNFFITAEDVSRPPSLSFFRIGLNAFLYLPCFVVLSLSEIIQIAIG